MCRHFLTILDLETISKLKKKTLIPKIVKEFLSGDLKTTFPYSRQLLKDFQQKEFGPRSTLEIQERN